MRNVDVNDRDIERCLNGERLFGDDFPPDEIERWFDGEKEGFAALWIGNGADYQYEYHALNHAHGFRYLPPRSFAHALSIGGAYGHELLPVLSSISRVTILEPSDLYESGELQGVPIRYVKPTPLGDMPFGDATFDLATCFGCLHHIPNVTRVMRELYRCLMPGGFALIREPIVSMGDWRRPRPGLTKMERGIPLRLFRSILADAGFAIQRESLCVFPLVPKLTFLFGRYVWNSRSAVALDRALARAFSWNVRYHPSRLWEKLLPTAVQYVLKRPS